MNISTIVNKVLEAIEDGSVGEGKLRQAGGIFQRADEDLLYLRKDSTLFDKAEVRHLETAGFFVEEKAFQRKIVRVYSWTRMLMKDEEADRAREMAEQALKQQKVAQRRLALIRKIHEQDLTAGRLISEHLGKLSNVKLGKTMPAAQKRLKVAPGTVGVPTLFISDVHYAETVISAEINGLNSYDLRTADQRIDALFENAMKMVGSHVKADSSGIVVALGGDMLSGNIHDELRESNEVPIIEAARLLALRLADGIHRLASQFKTVQVPCIVGNHGRMSRKPVAKGAVDNNFDKLVYLFLAQILQQDGNVQLHISDALDMDFQIFNTRYKLTHGDQFRPAGGIGGIWPSLMKGVANKQKRSAILGQPFDYLMMGHFHQLGFVESLIVNGSVKGYDEYAFKMNLPFERAQQALWITHPKEGLTLKMPVFCDDNTTQAERSSEGCAFTIAA